MARVSHSDSRAYLSCRIQFERLGPCSRSAPYVRIQGFGASSEGDFQGAIIYLDSFPGEINGKISPDFAYPRIG